MTRVETVMRAGAVVLRQLTGRRRRSSEPDPFEVLRLQERLGAVAGSVRELELVAAPFARAERFGARCAAYDGLLREACQLAGVPDLPQTGPVEERRWYAEQQLTERGWSW